jgi:hypothetical protein
MEFTKSITDLIKERSSWRTYSSELINKETKSELEEILKLTETKSPFDGGEEKCRFELITIPEVDPDKQKQLGTYGMISGAQQFIVGLSHKSEFYKTNFGYLFETIILKATDLKLGTCWLGGTFNRSNFSQLAGCQKEEVVPAITPIGYPKKRRTKEKVIRRMVGAKNRKPWEKLFFQKDFDTPLSYKELGDYNTLLEMVRLAPSAGNRQPWRILKKYENETYHFYVKYPEGKLASNYRAFVKIDIGIAICHFDLTAKELSISGNWIFDDPRVLNSKEDLKYVITWKGN